VRGLNLRSSVFVICHNASPCGASVREKLQFKGLVALVNWPFLFWVRRDGTFKGSVAASGNVDSQGDPIEPGTFKAAEGQQVPLLFAHKMDEPVGIGTVTETPLGLWVKGKTTSRYRRGQGSLHAPQGRPRESAERWL
jgi:hypothetical protein